MWHKTEGFREEALCLEASQWRYCDNAGHLNRYWRQWQEDIPVTTLQDNAQKEGARALDFLERRSQSVLQEHGFDGRDQPNEVALTLMKGGTGKRREARVQEQLKGVVSGDGEAGFFCD
jgi:hypothetical protein